MKSSLLIFYTYLFIFQFTVSFTELTIYPHLIMGIMEHTMPLITQPLPLTTPLSHITPKPHLLNVSLKLLVRGAVGMDSSSCCLILTDMDVMEQVSKFIPVMKNPAPLIATGAHGVHGPNVR